MGNMSYCRFQNTLTDLMDCKDALESLSVGDTRDGGEKLSADELRAAKRLVAECLNILELFELDDDDYTAHNVEDMLNKTLDDWNDAIKQEGEDDDE